MVRDPERTGEQSEQVRHDNSFGCTIDDEYQ